MLTNRLLHLLDHVTDPLVGVSHPPGASLLVGDLVEVRDHSRPYVLWSGELLFKVREGLLHQAVIGVRAKRLGKVIESFRGPC